MVFRSVVLGYVITGLLVPLTFPGCAFFQVRARFISHAVPQKKGDPLGPPFCIFYRWLVFRGVTGVMAIASFNRAVA